MSHLHIPDGIMAPIWAMIGILIAAALLTFSIYKLRSGDLKELVPKIGILGAVMLVGMILPLPLIGYHLNLSVLAGIILGPYAAPVATFVVNLILAITGHGGITVIGFNAIIMGAEATLGYHLFNILKRRSSIKRATFTATFIALILSTTLMIGVVALTNIDPGEAAGLHQEENLSIGHEDDHHEGVSLLTFAKIIVPFALIGWIIESFIISEVVAFIGQMRPELIGLKED